MFSPRVRAFPSVPAPRRTRRGGPYHLNAVLPDVIDELASLVRKDEVPVRVRLDVVVALPLLSNAA
jgi:hypothetical protein